MPHQSYYELCNLVAPGWSVHEGDAHPQADGPFSLTAPDYEDVIWRTWCHFFEYFSLQDGDVYVWPERPPDWRDRIARASTVWDESQASGKQVLEVTEAGHRGGQLPMNIEERIRDLEKATAIAFLDANLSGKRHATEAGRVTEALARGQHFRLIIETIDASGNVCATIEVESAEVTETPELPTEGEGKD